MGRLIEIIKENEESPSVTNRNYHMFSGIGNLFNLMMIISPENPYPFPVDANVSIISKMLSDFEDAKTVKALQTQFNKIKGFIKNNKIPKADVKKKYFLLLFNLLKSETDLKLNPTTLSNKFAAGGSSGAAKQRPEVIKIGKALLTSGKVELNQKDVKIIKTFMSHLGAGEEDTPIEQPVEDIENITKNTEEPVTPEGVDVVAKEMSEKTDDQLREIADKSDMIVKGVKDRHIDETAELEEVFNTNEDSNIFKVQFTDLDVEVGEIINKKIADNHAKIKAEYDLKTANFISKLTYDMFEQLDKNVNGYLNHFEDYIQIDVKKTNKGLEFTTIIGVDDQFNVERFKIHQIFNVDPEDGKSNAYLDHIQIPYSQQKKGIYKDIFKDNLDTYKAQGIEKLTLTANVDVGGYAWFRFGFTPKNMEEIKHIANWMRDESNRFAQAVKTDKESIINHIRKNSSDTTSNKTVMYPEVSNLLAFINENDGDIVAPVIATLVNRCADEFAAAFDDKSKFKGLNEYISTRVFTPQMIKGCDKPITLSCKSLLTLYAMKDVASEYDASTVIPVPGTGYLGWYGELLMDNLDDTYAYLNLK